MKTKSEKLFEKIIKSSGLEIIRIEENERKTPDFLLKIGDYDVLIEVKGISDTPEQKKLLKLISQNGIVSEEQKINSIEIVSNSVVNALKKASKQLKEYKSEKQICLIVLADERDFFFKDMNLIPYIKSMMIGVGHYQQDEDGILIEIFRDFGFFSSRQQYISAIVIMDMENQRLLFLHNENALESALAEPFISFFPDHEFIENTETGKIWSKLH